MSRRPRSGVAALALVVAATTASAGCGNDEGDSGMRPTTPAPPSSAATPDGERADQRPGRITAPATADGPAELARRLVAAEDAVRDPTTSGVDRRQAAFETQVLYRQLARRDAWQDEVLDAAGPYRAAMADHIAARTSLRGVATRLSDELPAWRIVEPEPMDELMRHYRKAERRYGVGWEVLAAVNLVETGFGRIRGYSSAGARGPMQFIASTWAAYGEGDIDDPHDSILAAARYLAANGGAAATGLDGALHAYNRHTGYVRGVRAYARILERDPGALAVLYRWQIVYLSTRGDLWLPVSYDRTAPIAVDRYLRRHPGRLLSRATD